MNAKKSAAEAIASFDLNEIARAAANKDGVMPPSDKPKRVAHDPVATFDMATPEVIEQNAAATRYQPKSSYDADPVEVPAVVRSPRLATEVTSMDSVFKLDISQLDDNPANSRVFYSEQEVADMAAALQRAGKQIHPIIVEANPSAPGRYYVIDGKTRMLGAKSIGWTQLDAVKRSFESDWERYRASYSSNNDNRHTSDYDNAFAWSALLQRKDGGDVITQERLATAVNLSKGHISKVLSLAAMPEEIQNVVRDYKQTLSVKFFYPASLALKEMTEAVDASEAVALVKGILEQAAENEMSAAQVEEMLGDARACVLQSAAATQNPVPATPERSAAGLQGLFLNNKSVGSFKTWHKGDTVKISLKADRLPLEAYERIQAILAEVYANEAQGATE